MGLPRERCGPGSSTAISSRENQTLFMHAQRRLASQIFGARPAAYFFDRTGNEIHFRQGVVDREGNVDQKW